MQSAVVASDTKNGRLRTQRRGGQCVPRGDGGAPRVSLAPTQAQHCSREKESSRRRAGGRPQRRPEREGAGARRG